MNVLDAAYRIGAEYPGGTKALAIRMGMSPAVLLGKLNPNTNTHHLRLDEAVTMQMLSGRADVLIAMADELGHVCIPKPDVGDEDISHALAHTCAEFGDYLRKVDDCLKDGKITPNERKGLERELSEMIAAATHLQALLAGKVGK